MFNITRVIITKVYYVCMFSYFLILVIFLFDLLIYQGNMSNKFIYTTTKIQLGDS